MRNILKSHIRNHFNPLPTSFLSQCWWTCCKLFGKPNILIQSFWLLKKRHQMQLDLLQSQKNDAIILCVLLCCFSFPKNTLYLLQISSFLKSPLLPLYHQMQYSHYLCGYSLTIKTEVRFKLKDLIIQYLWCFCIVTCSDILLYVYSKSLFQLDTIYFSRKFKAV